MKERKKEIKKKGKVQCKKTEESREYQLGRIPKEARQ